MHTDTRWAILMKLPAALSLRITLNSDPVAGEMRSAWLSACRPFNQPGQPSYNRRCETAATCFDCCLSQEILDGDNGWLTT